MEQADRVGVKTHDCLDSKECGVKDQEKYDVLYRLTYEQIKRYQKMSIKKRLEWLYLGNLLKKAFSEKIFDVWDKFPNGKI